MDFIILAVAVLAAILLGAFFLYASFYKKVDQGNAMIVNTTREEPDVTFTGRLVIPVIHRKEIMNISLKTIEIDRSGKDGLICMDNIRADIKVAFFVRVNKTKEDVLKVAQAIGCDRASDQGTMEDLFSAKFSEALKTVGKRLDFIDLYQERDRFRDDIIRVIGQDLNGYVLEDAAIDYLEQTPVESLDTDNILDAQGIRKITELTAIEHISTNDLRREEQMKIKKKDVETEETMLELERQRADAEAKQMREIASVQAREKSETDKIQAEERLKAEQANIKTDQNVAVLQENKQREIDVAGLNRERVVVIEKEKVQLAQQLEEVERNRAVELQTIEKEKAVEVEKKNIADVVRERVVVEKTVAVEEEAIQTVRVIADAERLKDSKVISAEGEAQESLVKEIKAAEADEIKASHKSKEEQVLAEGHLRAAELDAEAKKREAEGIEAVEAAPGLARARVQEAQADADEKSGLADAKVLEERLLAQAAGDEKVGIAAARIKEADAAATKVMGEADAAAIKVLGEAEASKVKDRFSAEAEGLREKFSAMKEMDENTRSHEEFRMHLDMEHEETMRQIETSVEIAHDHAEVLGKAMTEANIDIVGGNGEFFDKFVNSLAVGKSIDGVVNKSKIATKALEGHMNGDESIVGDIKELVAGLGAGSGSLQNLTVAAFLSQVMKNGTEDQKNLVNKLMKSFPSD